MGRNPLVFDIQRASYVDGPGIRTVVFFKGCPLDCAWCHNPESKSAAAEILYRKNRCTGCGACVRACPAGAVREDFTVDAAKCVLCGACADACPNDARAKCGAEMTAAEIADTVIRDEAYYAGSGGGVTFSGGECMLYPEFLAEILRLTGKRKIRAAIDTAGDVPWENFERVLPLADLFLYDVKHVSDERHRAGTGRGNGRILENLDRLYAAAPEKIVVRIPVIPGFNADDESLCSIRRYLDARPKLRRVEPLRYHRLGESKAEAAGRRPFSAPDIPAAEFERMKAILTGAAPLPPA